MLSLLLASNHQLLYVPGCGWYLSEVAGPQKVRALPESRPVPALAESQPVRVEEFAPKHQQGVHALLEKTFQHEYGLPLTQETYPDLVHGCKAVFQQKRGNFWVALDHNHKVVGTVALRDLDDDVAAVHRVSVDPSLRGKGVAQKLFSTMEQHAYNQGFKLLVLGTTRKMGRALSFYEKSGYNELQKDQMPAVYHVSPVENKFYAKTLPFPWMRNFVKNFGTEFGSESLL